MRPPRLAEPVVFRCADGQDWAAIVTAVAEDGESACITAFPPRSARAVPFDDVPWLPSPAVLSCRPADPPPRERNGFDLSPLPLGIAGG